MDILHEDNGAVTLQTEHREFYLYGDQWEELRDYILEQYGQSCPYCGTTEMLCGHGGVGCTSRD